jgi:hypothetical protein
MGVTSPPQDPLVVFRNADGRLDRLKVGEAEQARQNGRSEPLTVDEIAALDWLDEQPRGRLYVMQAAHAFHEWFARGGAAARGYTRLVSRKFRDGRWTTSVRRLRPPVPARRATNGTRVPSRSRERRPGATRRASSSSTTSSADPPGPASDSEPPAESWRWASETAWRSFVASVHSRDFEREVYRERLRGVAR